MQRTCEYCGSLFSFVRATKKYCSDNCKQMAYFKRNGFVPAHKSDNDKADSVSVKDVKYAQLNTHLKIEKTTSTRDDLEIVKTYAKCLIRNLLQLSRSGYVEQNTLLEFTAAWSQFTSWHVFLKKRSDFPYCGLFIELTPKLLAKSNFENGLVEVVLSETLNDQLEEALAEMLDVQHFHFAKMRF